MTIRKRFGLTNTTGRPAFIRGRWLAVLVATLLSATDARAAECFSIQASRRPDIGGKEADWIDGDIVLQNDRVRFVIAAPKPTRNANMTTRRVGAAVVDAVLRSHPRDQLTAIYPGGSKFVFEDASLATLTVDGQTESIGDTVSGKIIRYAIESSAAIHGSGASGRSMRVEYELRDAEPFLRMRLVANGDLRAVPDIGIRADRTFRFDVLSIDGSSVAVAEDAFFGYALGIVREGDPFQWGNQRLRMLSMPDSPATAESRIYPATSASDLAAAVADPDATLQTFRVRSNSYPVENARWTFTDSKTESSATLIADDGGVAKTRLRPGTYQVRITADGHEAIDESIRVDGPTSEDARTGDPVEYELPSPSMIYGIVTDGGGKAIPSKWTIYGRDGTPDPDFGPDSTRGSVKNVVYVPSGSMRRPIDPGRYELFVSYGPEYDAFRSTIDVQPGRTWSRHIELKRRVDSSGWISSDFHSHSSPSGDNTSDQVGRVENLVCEHIEFAPCTEHNRIDTYDDDLEAIGATSRMATCTGMELTGSPLPVNHQNAFPLHHHPHTQDGGGPTTDSDPIGQIERLAFWDSSSEKVVQGNHPDLRQIFDDRDLDGMTDGGFRQMLSVMDVVEIHPIGNVFDVATDRDTASGDRSFEQEHRVHRWMQLINDGHYVPGVVNTDAHYNHHGSGWLRNWIRVRNDDPRRVSMDHLLHQIEAGQMVMSTGPMLEASATIGNDDSGTTQRAEIGQTLVSRGSPVQIHVRVQCPNWFDIDRVGIFVNGRLHPELNLRRRTHPQYFHTGVDRFSGTFALSLDRDAHVIVATVGEDSTLGPVMGETFGEMRPAAITNPIFIDTDGNGFEPNGDDLDTPWVQTSTVTEADTDPPTPNVVLILADDLGIGDVSAYNPESAFRTEALDRLAAQGIRYTDAHTPSAVCTPTRYGLLTGRYCWRTRLKRGVLDGYGTPLIEAERPTIASVLRSHGYHTSVIGKWHLGLGLPGERGALRLDEPLSHHPGTVGFDHSLVIPASLDFPPYVYFRDGLATTSRTIVQPKQPFPRFLREGPKAVDLQFESCLDDLTEAAVEEIARMAERNGPSFLYFPLTAPHKPAWPAPRFVDQTEGGPYGDFVVQVDDVVGRLMKAIDQAGIDDETVVIFTSDNGSYMHRLSDDQVDHATDSSVQGYRLSRHQSNLLYRGTKADIWEGGHRVPMLVRLPAAQHAGTVQDGMVGLVDVLATLADYLDVDLPEKAAEDSVSFATTWRDADQTHARSPMVCHSVGGMFALRDDDWKLILGNGSGGRQRPKGKPMQQPWMLFDLASDPQEANDLADQHPERVRMMADQFFAIAGEDVPRKAVPANKR